MQPAILILYVFRTDPMCSRGVHALRPWHSLHDTAGCERVLYDIYIYIYTLLFVGTYPMPRSVQSVLPVDNSCTAIRYLLNTGHVRTFLF